MNPKKSLVIVSVLVLILAACGGNDGSVDTTAASGGVGDNGGSDQTSAPASPATTAPADNGGGGDTPAVSEMGSFTVNGTEFAVTFLNRCIPFSGPDSSDIDLQPIAQGQGAGLNLYGTADSVEVSVQGTAVEKIGGTNAFGADPFGDGEIRASDIDGDRWTGEATLADSYGSASTVEVNWDVMIPDEMIDCSL